MHIINNDFGVSGDSTFVQPVLSGAYSTVDVWVFPVNMEATHMMLGGDEPADIPAPEDFDKYFFKRGPIYPVLPPADFFVRLRACKRSVLENNQTQTNQKRRKS